MKDTELRKEKDREIYEIYLNVLQTEDVCSIKDAARKVLESGASKFYISSKSLVNYIGEVNRGKVHPKMFKGNREKLERLYENYLKFLKDNPDCKLSRERICEILVDEPAPRLYIDIDSVMKAILRERKRNLEIMIERYSK